MSGPCKACNGTGYMYEGCDLCERNGWVDDPSDDGTMTCPECDGESAELCPECEGDGMESPQNEGGHGE